MIDELVQIRATIFATLRSENVKHRRAVLIAFKHVDKAVRVLGGPKMDIPGRAASKNAVQYNAQEPEAVQETGGTVLADNAPPKTGPEKPVRKAKKP
jgi:hypothetical protein